jgi:hypothetical protein
LRIARAATKWDTGTRKSEKDYGTAKAVVGIDKRPFLVLNSKGMLLGGQFVNPVSSAVIMSMQHSLIIASYQRCLREFR